MPQFQMTSTKGHGLLMRHPQAPSLQLRHIRSENTYLIAYKS